MTTKSFSICRTRIDSKMSIYNKETLVFFVFRLNIIGNINMSSYKSMIAIHFSAYCITNFGETVIVVGNCPQLGMWNPQQGLSLNTTHKEYPIWFSKQPITLQKLTSLEFKLCVADRNGCILRWQSLKHNRILSLKTSCSIFLTEGQPQAQYDFQSSETTSTQIDSSKKAPLSEIEEQSEQDDSTIYRKNYKQDVAQSERKRSGSSRKSNWIKLEEDQLNQFQNNDFQ